MQKTLLLVFIHGFKGGESTFGDRYRFTEDLARLVADHLPKLNIRVVVYPRYETRGDLHECVGRFREWLLNNVIDMEVRAGTPSPTVDPSVRAVLIGHSMGGIVAAETAMAIAGERTIQHPRPPPQAGPARTSPEAQSPRSGPSSPPPPASPSPPSSSPPPPRSSRPSVSPPSSSPPPPRPPPGKRSTSASSAASTSASPELNSLMFPYIQAVLAFDTPFLGISPGVVAHGAEGHYNTASAALTQFNQLRNTFGWGTAAAGSSSASSSAAGAGAAARAGLPSSLGTAPAVGAGAGSSSSSSGGWGGWGKIAVVAGAVGTIAAGGAAAYMNREHLNTGWSWATSHLEFVGCLARGEELKRRVASMVQLERDLAVGFANLYTRLGSKAAARETVVGTVVGKQRTFCNLPSKGAAGTWQEAVNDNASDEVGAHMAMFEKKQNPRYDKLLEDAAKLIAGWTRGDWYEGSGPDPPLIC